MGTTTRRWLAQLAVCLLFAVAPASAEDEALCEGKNPQHCNDGTNQEKSWEEGAPPAASESPTAPSDGEVAVEKSEERCAGRNPLHCGGLSVKSRDEDEVATDMPPGACEGRNPKFCQEVEPEPEVEEEPRERERSNPNSRNPNRNPNRRSRKGGGD